MNKFKFLVLAFILTVAVSCGQQKRYVTYKVKEGETMRDIAKRLDMKTRDLLRLNPDVGRRPAENTTIIIPNRDINNSSNGGDTTTESEVDETVSESIETTPEVVKDTAQFKKVTVTYETHKVKKGETVWALTKKYNISKDELIALNPDIASNLENNKLAINQELKVKAIETVTYISLEDELNDFVTHTVQPKETVYSLTRFYNVSKEDLIALNSHLPNLKNNFLDVGDIVKIRPIREKLDTDSREIYTDSIQFGQTINLAMLLPFKAKKYDSVRSADIFGKGNKSKLANIVTDFYMGAEIAIDSLKRQGIDINTTVFDTGNRGENVATILSEDKLNNANVIIGPLYYDKAEKVASKVDVPVVYPHFSKNQTSFSSGRIVKTAPDISKYASTLTSYLSSKYTNETIFIVGDGNKENDLLVNAINNDLKKNDSIKEIVILKPKNNYIKKERFTDKMKPGSHCWIIMTSDDNVNIEDALNSMVVLPEKVTAQVFAVNKNNVYDKIDNNKLASIEFAYVTNDFVDENDIGTKIFNKKYRKLNHTNPSEYSIRGFDVTYDILVRLASGNDLTKTFKQGTSMRIGNRFDYDKKLFGSTSNNGLFLVKYNKDLSLTRLR